jgi:hypothetical protein
MLSNPPYGKRWKSDLERMGGKDGIKDPRFVIEHAGDPEFSLLTRSSDGQLLFLANMLSKMKHGTRLGSRIAEVAPAVFVRSAARILLRSASPMAKHCCKPSRGRAATGAGP